MSRICGLSISITDKRCFFTIGEINEIYGTCFNSINERLNVYINVRSVRWNDVARVRVWVS